MSGVIDHSGVVKSNTSSDFAVVKKFTNSTSLSVFLVDATGNQITAFSGMGLPTYDAVQLTQDATHDYWTFYTGGLGGTLVATITITYTDATKATISTVVKT